MSLSFADAWGTQYLKQIQHLPVRLSNGYFLLPQSIAPDGSFMLATASPPPISDGSSTDKPTKLLLIDLAGRQSQDIATPTNGNTLPYSAYSDGTWIVWSQAPQAPGFFSDWELYSYNRADRSTKQLAKAAHNKDGTPALGSDGSPLIDHGKVVWAEAVPDLGGAYRDVLKMEDLTTGQVTTLSTNGIMPRISWPYAAWLEVLDATPPTAPTAQGDQVGQPPTRKAAIVVLNLQTGTRTQLSKPELPVEFAIYRDSIAWIGTKSDRITLTNVAETDELPLPIGGSVTGFEHMTLNDRLVTWEGSNDVAVWDRRKNALITLPPYNPTHNFVGSQDLLWGDTVSNAPGADGEINILDTTKLP